MRHLIADDNTTEDVFTRAVPLLTVIFLFSMVSALDREVFDELLREVRQSIAVRAAYLRALNG